MYVLGHAGVTLYAARRVDPEIDWRAPVLLALLPDIVDKPLAWTWPALVNGSTRGFGHTFLAWLAALTVLALFRHRLKHLWLLWACFAGHAVLDMMWLGDSRVIFAWPLLGSFPPPRFAYGLSPAILYDIFGELLGFGLLLALYLKRKSRG